MRRTLSGRRIAPAVGALVTATVAAVAFAPAAFSKTQPPKPQTRVNSFTYDTTDATHHKLIFNATNTGKNAYNDFYIELTQTTKISNLVLVIGTTTYTNKCVAENGGWPAIQCSVPALLTPGTTFTLKFSTSTVYPAGSQNLWFADDANGANSGEFDGPA
jgi:hypothetical protein